MNQIQFTQQNDKYVYEYTSNGSQRTFQVKHRNAANRPLVVYGRIDSELPWAMLGTSESYNGITSIVTVGVPADVEVRIVSNFEPEVAGYVDAQ